LGFEVFLCASAYPEREITVKRVGIDVSDSIHGFTKPVARNEMFPFLGVYQGIADSYFFFKKLDKLDFIFITGGGGRMALMPKTIANKTLMYVHYIKDYPIDEELASQQDNLKSKIKRIYMKPWLFISNNLDISYNLDYIKRATIITNSTYTKNTIRDGWGMDSTVIYPPCPQYSFPLDIHEKRDNVVCSMARFTPEKNYELIIKIAQNLPNIRFELVGSVTQDKIPYLEKLIKTAPKNTTFHVNATIQEKMDVLKKSKVLIHSFIEEPFGIALIEAMSAGIIPVTHNSGAAKVDGIVPEEFRYNDFDSAVKSLINAISSWNAQKALRLREFAKSFSPESFRENLRAFISNWFKSMEYNHRSYEVKTNTV
jgi:glycosyltransferase involved in cell wall biosynthesis